eukprot:gene1868-465_t
MVLVRLWITFVAYYASALASVAAWVCLHPSRDLLPTYQFTDDDHKSLQRLRALELVQKVFDLSQPLVFGKLEQLNSAWSASALSACQELRESSVKHISSASRYAAEWLASTSLGAAPGWKLAKTKTQRFRTLLLGALITAIGAVQSITSGLPLLKNANTQIGGFAEFLRRHAPVVQGNSPSESRSGQEDTPKQPEKPELEQETVQVWRIWLMAKLVHVYRCCSTYFMGLPWVKSIQSHPTVLHIVKSGKSLYVKILTWKAHRPLSLMEITSAVGLKRKLAELQTWVLALKASAISQVITSLAQAKQYLKVHFDQTVGRVSYQDLKATVDTLYSKIVSLYFGSTPAPNDSTEETEMKEMLTATSGKQFPTSQSAPSVSTLTASSPGTRSSSVSSVSNADRRSSLASATSATSEQAT